MNPKQQTFVQEYLIDHNAAQAAIRAGYAPKDARRQGYRLLKMPEIAAAIAAGEAELAKLCQLNAQWVLKHLMAIAEIGTQTTPVYDSEGEPVFTLDGKLLYQMEDPEIAFRALSQMGRYLTKVEPLRWTAKDREEGWQRVRDAIKKAKAGGT